ncbi:hypothetical protein JKG68_31450 [Microvirga aerilata]|uniref:Uncharacterized protein n=1 Tax=Microvirga aerilata TaxID=670292 RepID=A0A937CZL9_9HYPH|nr:hypothetical protein [Microvirga aerilata]MBL0408388.1 hypothetical protein [Microvirga aerilata]
MTVLVIANLLQGYVASNALTKRQAGKSMLGALERRQEAAFLAHGQTVNSITLQICKCTTGHPVSPPADPLLREYLIPGRLA